MCDSECLILLYYIERRTLNNTNTTSPPVAFAITDPASSTAVTILFLITVGMLVLCSSVIMLTLFRIWERQNVLNRPAPQPRLTPMQEIVIPSIKAEICDGETCYACMEKEANTILLCANNHTGLCIDCARKIVQANMACPLCRQPVSGMVHLLETDGT